MEPIKWKFKKITKFNENIDVWSGLQEGHIRPREIICTLSQTILLEEAFDVLESFAQAYYDAARKQIKKRSRFSRKK